MLLQSIRESYAATTIFNYNYFQYKSLQFNEKINLFLIMDHFHPDLNVEETEKFNSTKNQIKYMIVREAVVSSLEGYSNSTYIYLKFSQITFLSYGHLYIFQNS